MSLRILFVGLGSIGSRHLRNVLKLASELAPDGLEILAFHSRKRECTELEKRAKVNIFYDLEEAISMQPDIVFICNPTSKHIPALHSAAEAGCAIFIEKPISHNREGITKLISICKKNNVPAFVAYCLRFHPAIQTIKGLLEKKAIGKVHSARLEFGGYLPDWRKNSSYEKSYSAKEDLGGGIMLDAIHEFDIAQWFFGKPKSVCCMKRRISGLNIETEDIAETIIEFQNGSIVNIHVDYFNRTPTRDYHIIGSRGSIRWNATTNRVGVYLASEGKWSCRYSGDPKRDYEAMYIRELKHFFDIVKRKTKNSIPVEESIKSLNIVLAAKESSETNRLVKVGQ